MLIVRGLVLLLTAVSLLSCAGEAAGPTGTGAKSTPTERPSPKIEEPSPTPATPEVVPEPVTTEQGGTYWGVYLAAGEGPDLEDAIQYLTEDRGLELGEFNAGSDVHCDGGARKALGGAGPLVVAVYFDSEEDAQAWAATLPAPPLAIARVRTFCLD